MVLRVRRRPVVGRRRPPRVCAGVRPAPCAPRCATPRERAQSRGLLDAARGAEVGQLLCALEQRGLVGEERLDILEVDALRLQARRQLQRERLLHARLDEPCHVGPVADEARPGGGDRVVRLAHQQRRPVDGARRVEGVVEQRLVLRPDQQPPRREPRHVRLIVGVGVEVVRQIVRPVARRELLQHGRGHGEGPRPAASREASRRDNLVRAAKPLPRPRASDPDGGRAAVEGG
mmetsp:Transcript_15610/g.44855  ORF Transcript_15610/g.44855 Transcript_15610/m.44855 type:complete len:233 (-) Transcript_15610:535-1233(-)